MTTGSVFTYFEPLTAGHCAFWARMVLTAAAKDPRVGQLRLETNAPLAERLSDVIKATGLELKILPEDAISSFAEGLLLARGCAQWAHAREILEQHGGHVFLPFFDHAIYGSMLDRRPVNGKISGTIFRPPNDFGYPASARRQFNALRRWGSYIAGRRPGLGTLFTLDEGAAKASGTGLRQLVFLPDPTPDPTIFEGAAFSPRSDGRRWFLVFGALAERKGIFKALDAGRLLPREDAAQIGLRFAGQLDAADRAAFMAQVDELLEFQSGLAVEIEDRFLSDSELASEIASCDVVLAPYQNHIGSSGVVLWAATARKPLICQNTGAMAYQVAKHGLGFAIDCTDAETLALALTADIQTPTSSKLVSAHTRQAFCAVILEACLS